MLTLNLGRWSKVSYKIDEDTNRMYFIVKGSENKASEVEDEIERTVNETKDGYLYTTIYYSSGAILEKKKKL